MKDAYTDLATIFEPAADGDVAIEHVVIDADEARFSRMRAAMGHYDELVHEGKYALLRIGGQIVMSDTRMERDSNWPVVLMARGDVLIAGLGLGLIVIPIAQKSSVKSITVVEKNPRVIALVEERLRRALGKDAAKLTIVQDDILTWKPPWGAKWDTIYFDIWANITTENLPTIAFLHRRFAARKRPGGWMDSWQRARLRSQARQGR